jgi:hypothetical protein
VPIPDFREDGYLPEGLHQARETEVLFRFGSPTRKRRTLALQLRNWLRLARSVKARRFFVNGSFVTAKPFPGDLDAVVQLSDTFGHDLDNGVEAAAELEGLLTTHRMGDLFAAEDDADWSDWLDSFTGTREADGRRKGVVEVLL